MYYYLISLIPECRKPLDICTNPKLNHESAIYKLAYLFIN
jgi:hypothetical protein